MMAASIKSGMRLFGPVAIRAFGLRKHRRNLGPCRNPVGIAPPSKLIDLPGDDAQGTPAVPRTTCPRVDDGGIIATHIHSMRLPSWTFGAAFTGAGRYAKCDTHHAGATRTIHRADASIKQTRMDAAATKGPPRNFSVDYSGDRHPWVDGGDFVDRSASHRIRLRLQAAASRASSAGRMAGRKWGVRLGGENGGEEFAKA